MVENEAQYLREALQDAQAEIERLRTEVATLRAMVAGSSGSGLPRAESADAVDVSGTITAHK